MHAMRDTLDEFPSWVVDEEENFITRGDAWLVILGQDPYLLRDVDPALTSIVQKKSAKELAQVAELGHQNPPNWSFVAYPTQAWAASVFPDLPISEAVTNLWEYVVQFCHLDSPDPIQYWKDQIIDLRNRSRWLTQKQFKSLQLIGPGTNLMIRLPKSHIWMSGGLTHKDGFDFLANIPTEEVFTLPDRSGVDGHLKATKPFACGSLYIDGMSLDIKEGKVIKASAKEGEELLKKALETDDGACRFGEVALVPHSTPISQCNQIFNTPLFDENASVHLALGFAYRFNLDGGEEMNDEEFKAAGGNVSYTHRDFMIGSAEMDIDGVYEDGSSLPLMRTGEWAFDVE